MKALSIRIVAGTITLGALLYFLACSSPTPNNNSSQNQPVASNHNQTSANSSSNNDGLKACDDYGSDPNPHAQHIKKDIEDKMDPELKRLLKTASNPNGTFTIEVKKADGDAKYFVAYIKGKVSGDDNLKELSDILNDFQSKQECLRVIYFLPEGAPSLGGGGGFEWVACEWPMVVCPNGECCNPVDNPNPSPTPPANSNGNPNSNSNSNVNLRQIRKN